LLPADNAGVSQANPELLALLPWLTPVQIGPMLTTILMGGMPGVLAAGIVSTLTALMQGHSLAAAVIFFLSTMTGIYFCRNIQVRARVVRAGLMAGMVFAAGAFLTGFRDNLEFPIILMQMASATFAGVITGILMVGLLPLFENLLKTTSDITLLELTDFNHPLLRQMQVKAPGSYHHSLMVANLSENAAAGIGANALLCRVCALYHDIGKMVKPEYFTENQREGLNPHHERNPSMSALIIKAHVKEGVVLARQFKLPRVIVDVIREHHGTSLIQYFYYKALQKQRSENTGETQTASNIPANAPRIELNEVNEETYRYEGPTPHFKESAIIMLADSIEAASRSLRKVNHQSVEGLINKIVTDRMQDKQLDQVDITLGEIARIKQSFAFSLLNMMHTRVEYPSAPNPPMPAPPPAEPPPTSPKPSAEAEPSHGENPNGEKLNPEATEAIPPKTEDSPRAT
jgi:cyclic-di-AMP phosphodiesterase PgpH